MKKLRVKWRPGSEFLVGSIEQATENLLFGDRIYGDGKMTKEKARELVIFYREKHKLEEA